MPTYRDEAVILRTHKLGEADRIVTMLTRYHGQVRAVAKGVRRTASKFGSRLEPFMVADIQFYEGRNLDTVSQVESIYSFGADIVSDYASYTAATAMVETAEKLTGEMATPQQYLLLLGALRSLAKREHDSSLIYKDVPQPFTATRYHSLAVVDSTVPAELIVTSRTAGGVIMGLQHASKQIYGVQFHPESVLTQGGYQMLGNWLESIGLTGAAERAKSLSPLVNL